MDGRKSNITVSLIKYQFMKTCETIEVKAHEFFSSSLNGCVWQVNAPLALFLKKEAPMRTQWIGS
jgi:hypothetical protein